MKLPIIACILLGATNASAAFVAKGTLRYNRNWSGNDYSSTSDIPSSLRTGVHPLKDVRICIRPAAGGAENCAWTNNLGQYTINVTGGSGLYSRRVYFHGQSRTTPGNAGYKVVVSNTDGSVLIYNMTNFTGPSSGTVEFGVHTMASCSPATATCPNDFANGHQVMQWTIDRWVNTYQFNTISLFNPAVDQLMAFTDRTSNVSCAFGGNPFCFNFDYGMTDITTGWHEIAHTMLDKHGNQFNAASYGNYVSQGSCEDDGYFQSGGVDEAIANLNSVLMGYSENAAGTLSSVGAFCFSTNEPDNDSSMSCVSCEYDPNPNVYPQPQACGDYPNAIRRTECRALKTLINLLDAQSNNMSCINEVVNITYKQLWQLVVTVPNGDCEGCTQETGLGGSATGNATSKIDAFSMMDILDDVRSLYGIQPGELYKVWANACYVPGEAAWPTGTFLPSSQQGTPFP